MPETDQWTIGRLLNWTVDYFRDRGVDSPRLDAEVLLAEARECERIELYTAFEEPASERTKVAFRELVRRRAEGSPVAYLVGRKEFYARTFHVTPEVLIPRPETEFVLIALLDQVKTDGRDKDDLRIADVGTGSGVLAVCAALEISGSTITAIDLSPAALAVAKRNADDHGVGRRIEFVESDLFENVAADEPFDFVVSNPPYVTAAEFANLPDDVKKFEPRQALVAGPEGTEVIDRLLTEAAPQARLGGWLLIEISPMIAAKVESLVRGRPEWDWHETVKDLAGLDRVVRVQRAAN